MKISNELISPEQAAVSRSEPTPRRVRTVIPRASVHSASGLAKQLAVSTESVLIATWIALLWRLTRVPEITVTVKLASIDACVRTQLSEQTRFVEAVLVCERQSGPGLECEFTHDESIDADAGDIPDYELRMDVSEEGLSLHYDSSLFRTRADVIAEQYVTLLDSAAREPQSRLAALSINSSRHRAVLHQRHDPMPRAPLRVPSVELYAEDLPGEDLIDQFERRAAQAPTAIALVTNADVLTYQELSRRANKLARHLRQLGVGPESRVALCLERNSDMLIAVLAVLKAGGAYVPLDPGWPTERVLWILQESHCCVLVSCKPPTPALDDLPIERLDLEQSRTHIDACPHDDLPRIAQSDSAAYVIYTSGSTGRPKGVVVTRANVANLFCCTKDLFHCSSTDVWSMCHSYAFDYSVWEMWGAWLYGGKLVLASRIEAQSPELLYELLERERVTVLSQTPSGFRALLQELNRVPSRGLHAHTIVFGGEALDPTVLRGLCLRYPEKRLVNMYGITETTVHSTYRRVLIEDMSEGGRSPIGVELPDSRIYVLDRDLREVGIGETGEIFIAGPGLARCYLDNAALTAERFMPELAGPRAGERMYRTGDLARRLPNAQLEYLGRCDQQVKLRGYRIELGEIESSLRALSGVREAAVLLDEDAEQPRLVAYVFGDTQTDLTAGALRERLLEKLPGYMVPAAFVTLDTIPVTANGKLDKKALPKAGTERLEQAEAYVAPRTQLERGIAAIWAEALRIESVGVRDNFFDLGGHSLLLIQVQERLREDLGLNIPVVELFARPNVSLLAEFAAGGCATQVPIVTRENHGVERGHLLRRRREARRATPVPEQGAEVTP